MWSLNGPRVYNEWQYVADDGDDGGFDDSAGWSDTDFGNEESMAGDGLLEAPRKVEKITVTYSKASKQVWLVMLHVTGRSSEQQ